MSAPGDIKKQPEWIQAMTEALLQALKLRDPYTYGHSRRVGRNARKLAAAAGLNEFEQRTIELSSVFHDLGKLSIPDSILLKPGRLNAEETVIMKQHPLKSVEALLPLENIPVFKATLPGIRSHHERIDGRGYPDGLAGDKIPLAARIILIADTFDAMTTTRAYRKGLPFDYAYQELKVFSGRQFDPALVKIFLQAHPAWEDFEIEFQEEFIAKEAIGSPRKKSAA
ncbi:MAG: HD-GYP domain-containing protein [Oligoflexia bacterium]|nr:HD-GYP domain-containing protein [Oligoflexia bacterium]